MKKWATLLVVLILIVCTLAVVAVLSARFYNPSPDNYFSNEDKSTASWQFDFNSKTWAVNGSPPPCPERFQFPSPVDVTQATSILYPGQIRGGDYKPHGGFRFDNLTNNTVNVSAPFEGYLFKAARHTQGSEIQYVMYVMNDCGMMYKLDHLLELTASFNDVMQSIRLGGDTDTRTTQIDPPIFIQKGEHIATKVGLTGNVFFDFGVYDVRKSNGVTYDVAFRARFPGLEEYGQHAICWLNNLEEPAQNIVQHLPGADGQNGKKSDYCN